MAVVLCRAGGRLFSRCQETAVDTCIFCGHPFCQTHTYHIEGHETVCTRKRCSSKQDDLKAHMLYQERVRQRNAANLCAEEGCGPHPREQCSLCRAQFCERHVMERLYPFREGRVVIQRPASVCAWCWGRRKVWRS